MTPATQAQTAGPAFSPVDFSDLSRIHKVDEADDADTEFPSFIERERGELDGIAHLIQGSQEECLKRFTELTQKERLQVLKQVHVLQNAIYKERMTKREREGKFINRLKGDWRHRLAYVETMVSPEVLNAPITEDHPGVRLEDLWNFDYPPERLVHVRRTKKITGEEEMRLLLDVVQQAADRKRSTLTRAEEEIREAIGEESNHIRLALRLSQMGVEDETVQDMCDNDGPDREHSIFEAACEAAAKTESETAKAQAEAAKASTSISRKAAEHLSSLSSMSLRSETSMSSEVAKALRDREAQPKAQTYTDAEADELALQTLRDLPQVKLQGKKWSLSTTQDTPELMGTFALICREYNIWGTSDPDLGVDTDVHGTMSPTDKQIHDKMKLRTKENNEKRKLKLLKGLLADYDSGEQVDSGQYRNIFNPMQLVKELERKHEERKRDFSAATESSTEPVSFQLTVRPALEERFQYLNPVYAMQVGLSETVLDSYDLQDIKERMKAIEEKLKEEEDELEEFERDQEGVKRPWRDTRLSLIDTAQWAVERIEHFARKELAERGNTEDKYSNWPGPTGELNKLWIRTLDERLQSGNRPAAARQQSRAKFVAEGDGNKRPSFKWSMLTSSLSSDPDIPLEPTAILEWTQKYMDGEFKRWVADGALDATVQKEPFKLKPNEANKNTAKKGGRPRCTPKKPERDCERNGAVPDQSKEKPRERSGPPKKGQANSTPTSGYTRLQVNLVVGTGTAARVNAAMLDIPPQLGESEQLLARRALHLQLTTFASTGAPDRRPPWAKSLKHTPPPLQQAAIRVLELHREIFKAGSTGAKHVPEAIGQEYNQLVKQIQTAIIHKQDGGVSEQMINRLLLSSASEFDKAAVGKVNLPESGCSDKVIAALKCFACTACGCCQLSDASNATFHTAVDNKGKICQRRGASEHYKYWADRFAADDAAGRRRDSSPWSRPSSGSPWGTNPSYSAVASYGDTGGRGRGRGSARGAGYGRGGVRGRPTASRGRGSAAMPDNPNYKINAVTAHDSPLLKFEGKMTGELYETATQAKSNGGRKGEPSIFNINQQNNLKVGDELPEDDARMHHLRKTLEEGNATEQKKLFMANMRHSGICQKADDPSKAFVIATVRTGQKAAEQPKEREVAIVTGAKGDLMAPESQGWLSRCKQAIGHLVLDRGADQKPYRVQCVNTERATLSSGTSYDHKERSTWSVSLNPVTQDSMFGSKPADYEPRPATFQPRANRLPVGTMSFAKNGATVSGIYDSGAEVCVLSTRVALEMGLLPWDGERDARAANGESMIVHGVANSVETYHDGARLMIDFLITDLDGEFDFLLGWNAIQHYGLAVDSQTGQLKGTDYDGHKFVTKSQFAYTSLVLGISLFTTAVRCESASARGCRRPGTGRRTCSRTAP